MIVVVSNREVKERAKDHNVFGDKPNKKGLDELRLATAEFDADTKDWKVDLLPEKTSDLQEGNPPSRQLFEKILKDIYEGKLNGDWVLFVHGFNQSFLDNLTKCKSIEELYGVNVLAFSWPSNQGGLKPNEYKKARAAAKGCSNAFDRMLEKLGFYLANRPFKSDCVIRVSLLAYSMGNYVVQKFVEDPVFCDETKIFDNIILTQADVDVEKHASWVAMMDYGKRVYVTINEDDSVLKWSDVVNPPRLGNTVRWLDARGVVYFNFTDGKSVGRTHGIFYKTAKKNDVIRQIFHNAITGKRAEKVEGIRFDEPTNTYELVEKE